MGWSRSRSTTIGDSLHTQPLPKHSTATVVPRAKRAALPEGEDVRACGTKLHDEPNGIVITGSVVTDEPVEVLAQLGNSARIKNQKGQIGWMECE